MKSQLIKRIFIIAPLMLFFAVSSYAAATTFDWAGNATTGSKTDWTNPRNWVVGTTIQTAAYPGFNGTASTTTDIVRIGVSTSTAVPVFTNFPILAKSLTIASLTFGNNHAPLGNDGGMINLTINNAATATVLTVNGPIQQNHSTTGGLTGTGGTTTANASFEDFTYGIQTTLSGTGSIVCTSFVVGDTGLPTNSNVVNVTAFRISNVATSSLSVTVNGPFTLNSASGGLVGGFVTKSSRALVSIGGGTLTVNGTIKMTNTNPGPIKFAEYEALVGMSLDLNAGSTNSPVLNIGGMPAFNINGADNTANSIDFYNPLGGTGTCTANYTAAGNQIVNTGWSDFTDIDPDTYQNLGFSGSGTKTVDGDTFTVLGNFTLGTGSETVDLATNNPALTISGNYSSAVGTTLKYGNTNNLTISGTTTNNGTFNQSSTGNVTFTGAYTSGASSTLAQTGTGTLTFSAGCSNGGTQSQGTGTIGAVSVTGTLTNSGTITQTTGAYTVNGSVVNSVNLNLGSANFSLSGDYTNTGSYKQTTGTTIFNGSSTQNLSTSGTTAFHNVTFNGTGSTKSLNSGNFTVGDIYVMAVGGSNNIVNMNGASLTFLSDANGSATLSALLNNCKVSGTNITVQRYMSANRGYRLMSSPVIAGSANGNNIYSINYLLDSTFVSGLGFSSTTTSKNGNPSIYLFRENLAPKYTSFLNSNYRGVASLAASPLYTFSPDAVNSDVAANIPVGSGYLLYFRGGLKTLTIPLANPFSAGSAAAAGTLATKGAINQGNVVAHDWYDPTATHLGFTTTSVVGTDVSIEGLNLLGNPYPSSIDWDTFGTGILENQVNNYCYKLIPPGLPGANNYDVYTANLPGNTTKKGTQGIANANIIVSGEGFFVKAIDNTATLTFTEAAKTNSQVTGGSLYMAKIPTKNIVVPQYIRLQIAADTINTDGIIINFNNNAKAAFDVREDAQYKYGTGRVNISSFTSDKVAVAINSLPLVSTGQMIPLRVGAAANGTYSLNITELSGIPEQLAVWLKDAYTKDSVDMRKTPAYSFAVNLADTNSFGSNRFAVVINQDPAYAYKLLSFDAEKVSGKQQVEVSWKTASEFNNTQFTVQRSTDNGKHFDNLGAAITSNGSGAYSFVDKEPVKGDNLYRLQQVDYINNTTLSNVADVKISEKDDNGLRLSVYPNPTVNHITLSIDPKSTETVTYRIKISNSFGMIVKQAITTQTDWEDNVSNLFTGTYLIQVLNDKSNSLIGQTKFVKL